ncbi:hypothetical protein [Tabrizicola sp.]|uniref:hypothetical protein n=1 Tax=Tabrizicola sp. TaxID=2005166 RepID=UPI003F2FE87D
MRAAFCCALFCVVLITPASAACYHKHDDATETIRDVEETGGLVWEHKGQRVEFETGSGGTGVEYRIAFDPQGKGFRYEFDDDDLIFGGVRYVKGCS